MCGESYGNEYQQQPSFKGDKAFQLVSMLIAFSMTRVQKWFITFSFNVVLLIVFG
ncbi:hypothetical protein ACS0TY_003108 [Phlomoides rotata]